MSVVMDPEALNGLERDFGDRQVVREVVALFLEQLRQRQPEIAHAAAAGDLVGVHRAAHTLGSASAMVGALDLLGWCRKLEKYEATDASTAGGSLLAAWTTSCGATATAMTAWLATA